MQVLKKKKIENIKKTNINSK